MDNSGVVGQAYYSAFSLENSVKYAPSLDKKSSLDAVPACFIQTSNYVLNLGAFLGNRGELQKQVVVL